MAIAVIGHRSAGKSTLIRALTGIPPNHHEWQVRDHGNRALAAFVITGSPQERTPPIAPADFPGTITRGREYRLLICAIELETINRPPAIKYLRALTGSGHDTRVALIQRAFGRETTRRPSFRNVTHYARRNNFPLVMVDANQDPNVVAHRIRSALYP